MNGRADRAAVRSRYPLHFGIATLVLTSCTLVLVLVVLPQRYVLGSSFRESGMSFPVPITPFSPRPQLAVRARTLPAPMPDAPPGPAQLLWAEVTPLLRGGQLQEAIPVLRSYLTAHPEDTNVARELAVTLVAAGRSAEAVPILSSLPPAQLESELGLLLARTLRDLGRTADASLEYGRRSSARPDDAALNLEWARAHAWVEEYDRAAEILSYALSRDSSSVPLRIELARVHYATGRLLDAEVMLDGLSDAELTIADALRLRDDVAAALFVPPEIVGDSPPPTPLERATRARAEGEFELAKTVLDQALAERPGDPELLKARADLLQYGLADLGGAREALLVLERVTGTHPGLQLRLAQLDLWTGSIEQTGNRLEQLLIALESGEAREEVPIAEVLALLGDLRRWEGDRISADRSYRRALGEDPDNERALDGMAALAAGLARQLVEIEAPGVSWSAYSLGDTDDYARTDFEARWTQLRGQLVWSGSAGNRWLGGIDRDGLERTRQGIFADLTLAKWWRLGTIRTGLSLGAQRLCSDWHPRLGLSLGHRGAGGQLTDLHYEHGPAYPVTATLQSAVAGVVQDRLTLSHIRPLNEKWSMSAAVDVARLWTPSDGSSAGPASTERIQVAASAGRAVTGSLTLGISARALTFTDAAPPSGEATSESSRPLFWDPQAALSAGPYAQVEYDPDSPWRVRGWINPGLSFLDPQRSGSSGHDLVPQLSAEAGVRHDGARLSTGLDLFYHQGQFDGYRTYGARLSISARDLPALGGSR